MARETYSEKMVRIAALSYKKLKIADIEKVDAKMRIVGGRAIFSSSTGLDFVGNYSGKYISFEVKETERDGLPIDNIRQTQINKMVEIQKMNGLSFLLICFLDELEWFSIGPDAITKACDIDAAYLQKEYFIAFGKMIGTKKDNSPDFLSPEAHPLRDVLMSSFPNWVRYRRERKPVEQKEPTKLSLESYKERVKTALNRGIISAACREQKVQIFKRK